MPLGQGSSGIKDAMMGFLDKGNVGGAQAGTPNAPMGPGVPGGGISIPASQLGPVAEGDTVTLTVVAVDGENVSLEKVEEALPEAPPEMGPPAGPPPM
jgi:hypothetical protein